MVSHFETSWGEVQVMSSHAIHCAPFEEHGSNPDSYGRGVALAGVYLACGIARFH